MRLVGQQSGDGGIEESITETDDLARARVKRDHKQCRPLHGDTCEVGCGPATHIDAEGIPLCCECALLAGPYG